MQAITMNLLMDSSFIDEKLRRNVTQNDIAKVLEVDEDQVFTYTSRCVIHHLKHMLNHAKSRGKKNEVTTQLAAAKVVNLRKCRLHKKENWSVAACLEAILRFETENQDDLDNTAWSAGSCHRGVQRRVHVALPNVPILTVDATGVRRVY